MNFSKHSLCLISTLAFLFCLTSDAPILARVWSIDDRQLQLMQDINKEQKSKHLTDKEAKKLREQLSDVARKKRKFQKGDSQSNHFSDAQKAELDSDLTKVSDDIKKLVTAKQAPAK